MEYPTKTEAEIKAILESRASFKANGGVVRVGKYNRPVDLEIRCAWRCKRWDVYPEARSPRFMVAIVCGETYARDKSGIWFPYRFPIGQIGKSVPSKVLARVSPDAAAQIEKLARSATWGNTP